jgi:hypothetical protein
MREKKPEHTERNKGLHSKRAFGSISANDTPRAAPQDLGPAFMFSSSILWISIQQLMKDAAGVQQPCFSALWRYQKPCVGEPERTRNVMIESRCLHTAAGYLRTNVRQTDYLPVVSSISRSTGTAGQRCVSHAASSDIEPWASNSPIPARVQGCIKSTAQPAPT